MDQTTIFSVGGVTFLCVGHSKQTLTKYRIGDHVLSSSNIHTMLSIRCLSTQILLVMFMTSMVALFYEPLPSPDMRLTIAVVLEEEPIDPGLLSHGPREAGVNSAKAD